MGRFTRRVTNLHLLQAALLVLLLVGLTIVWRLFDSGATPLILPIQIIALGGSSVVVIAVYKRAVKDKNSIWLQPVSESVGKAVINSVVSLWLGVFGLIIYIFLTYRTSTKVVIVVTLLLLAGVGLGQYLQKRWASHTLLPYGISALGVLLMILIIFAVTSITNP